MKRQGDQGQATEPAAKERQNPGKQKTEKAGVKARPDPPTESIPIDPPES